jgi:superkiller protein 3
MGNLTFELVPRDRDGLLALREAKYRRALGFDGSGPGSAGAHYNLANVLRDRGELAAAEAEYRAAIEADPTHLWSLHNLSMLLAQAGRVDEAVDFARREVAVTPDSAAALNNLGNALRGAGRDGEAVAAFRRALEIDPRFELARNNLRIMTGE